MYKNLKQEMESKGITIKALAAAIGVQYQAVSLKISGESDFWFTEAQTIRDVFFPGMQLEYLFEKSQNAA